MYSTCAFCNATLDGDGGPSGLGVGRRLAFDEWRARLWVVCPKCSRWNLTPLDDRLERIEAVARAAADARLLASTEQVALLRWQRYDLIRIGKPLRVELAGWRYGERLRARNRERAKVVVPLTLAAVGLGVAANVALGGSFGFLAWNLGRSVDDLYVWMIGTRPVRLVEPPICDHCGTVCSSRRNMCSTLEWFRTPITIWGCSSVAPPAAGKRPCSPVPTLTHCCARDSPSSTCGARVAGRPKTQRASSTKPEAPTS